MLVIQEKIYKAAFTLFKESPEIKVLIYFTHHGDGNLYFAGKGSRAILCDRLKISKSTYAKAVNKLLKAGVIAKRRNAKMNQYHYYEIL